MSVPRLLCLVIGLCLTVGGTAGAAKRISYYELLEVPKDADFKEIKRAYRTIALKNHPDKAENPEKRKELEQLFMKIVAAYEALSDEQIRKRYDEMLKNGIYEYSEREWEDLNYNRGRRRHGSYADAEAQWEDDMSEEELSEVQLWIGGVGCVLMVLIFYPLLKPPKKPDPSVLRASGLEGPKSLQAKAREAERLREQQKQEEQKKRDSQRAQLEAQRQAEDQKKQEQEEARQRKLAQDKLKEEQRKLRREQKKKFVTLATDLLKRTEQHADLVAELDPDFQLMLTHQQPEAIAAFLDKLQGMQRRDPAGAIELIVETHNSLKQSPQSPLSSSSPTSQDQKSESKSVESKQWTAAELSLLARAIARFPAGTQERWEKVTKMINSGSDKMTSTGEVDESKSDGSGRGKTVKEVIQKAKEMEVKHLSGSAAPAAAATPAAASATSSEWTAEDQKLLEAALRTVDKADPKRWEKIAAAIPGKTKDDCQTRFKVIQQQLTKARGK